MVRRSVRHPMTVSSSLGRHMCKPSAVRLPSQQRLFFHCPQWDRKVSATLLPARPVPLTTSKLLTTRRGRLAIGRASNGPLRTGGVSRLAVASRP
jgi:hypothetical protein